MYCMNVEVDHNDPFSPYHKGSGKGR